MNKLQTALDFLSSLMAFKGMGTTGADKRRELLAQRPSVADLDDAIKEADAEIEKVNNAIAVIAQEKGDALRRIEAIKRQIEPLQTRLAKATVDVERCDYKVEQEMRNLRFANGEKRSIYQLMGMLGYSVPGADDEVNDFVRLQKYGVSSRV